MKKTTSIIALSAFALSSSADAFVLSPHPAAGRLSTTGRSMVATEKVISPPKTDADTQETYDQNVQTTYGRYPLTISHGKGCNLYTTDGTEYLDFVSGIATCALGHANAALTDAITKQMNQVHHVSNLYYIPEQAQLASWLCENSVADKAFFCNSGAEANEAAIKLARKYASTVSDRALTDPIIMTAHSSFHGRTLAAISATGQAKYHEGFKYGGEMVPGFVFCDYNDVEGLQKLVAELNETPPDMAKAGRKRGVAAILLEPLQGEGGIRPGTKEFFQAARSLMDDCDGLLMCDEVQVGMGRSGTLWGHEQLDVVPDVFTSAKALGGGVPIGAMMARGKAATTFAPGDHASTYGGNPLACAAGLAVAEQLSDPALLQNVRDRGDQLSAGLEKLQAKYPNVLGEIRGWGLLKGVETVGDITAGELVGLAMKEGLLLVPAGATVVRFVPPLIVTKEQVEEALEMFEKAIVNKIAADSGASP